MCFSSRLTFHSVSIGSSPAQSETHCPETQTERHGSGNSGGETILADSKYRYSLVFTTGRPTLSSGVRRSSCLQNGDLDHAFPESCAVRLEMRIP